MTRQTLRTRSPGLSNRLAKATTPHIGEVLVGVGASVGINVHEVVGGTGARDGDKGEIARDLAWGTVGGEVERERHEMGNQAARLVDGRTTEQCAHSVKASPDTGGSRGGHNIVHSVTSYDRVSSMR